MIFVTVGTHEQQFNRLMKEIDRIGNSLSEEIVVQYGYSDYIPNHCKAYQMISASDMEKYVNEARIVITHGGPGSIMAPLLIGKKPIVVPRQAQFNEHVNDHQVLFTKHLEKENKIIAIYNIEDLENAIQNYNTDMVEINIKENTKKFVNRFEEEVMKLFK